MRSNPLVPQLSLGSLSQTARAVLRQLAELPARDHDTKVSKILVWNLLNTEYPKFDAFTYTALLLAEIDHGAGSTSVVAHLGPKPRQEFELQALVLCTLLEKTANRELVEIAFERLGAIFGEAAGEADLAAEAVQSVAEMQIRLSGREAR